MLAVNAHPVSDFDFYFERGLDIAAGRGFQINGHPTAFWPPGYPAFLASIFLITGPSVLWAKLGAVYLWGISTALVYILGLRLGGPAVALLGAIFVAVHPDLVMMPALIASENLAIPLLLGALVLAVEFGSPSRWNAKQAGLVGAVFGAGLLVRPTTMLLVPLVCFVLVLRWRDLQIVKTAAILLIASIMVVAPWVLRNQIVMGSAVISTNGGMAVWWGANKDANGGYHRSAPSPELNWRDSSAEEIKENQYYARSAVSFITQNPDEWLGLAPAKLERLFGKQPMLYWHYFTWDAAPPPRQIVLRELSAGETRVLDSAKQLQQHNQTIQFAIWTLGMVGMIVGLARSAPVIPWISLIVAYWLIFHSTISNGQPRYLLAVTPLVLLAVAYLLATCSGALWTAVRRLKPAPDTRKHLRASEDH